MFILCVVIILSLVSRYYREEISTQLVGDPVVEKVMELQKKFNIRKDEPEEPIDEKPRARPSKMAFLQKERNKHMMRDFEKQARFQEDSNGEEPQIVDMSESANPAKPDLITE